MEDGLVLINRVELSNVDGVVLILVVVEDGLVPLKGKATGLKFTLS